MLHFRSGSTAEEVDGAPWQNMPFRARRRYGSLFFNPQVAFQMFSDTLLRHLVQEVSSAGERLEESSSFKIIQNYVFRTLTREKSGPAFFYQFKVQMREVTSPTSSEDLLISKVFQGPPK